MGTASPPPRGAARSRRPQAANPPAEIQRKTFRPLGANTLTQFVHPGQPVRTRSRPLGANTPAAVRAPRLSGAEKEPPGKGEPANAVRAPRLSGAEKEPPVRGEPACGSSSAPLGRCRKSGKSRKNFPARKGSKNARSHAEKTPIRTVWLAKPNRAEFSRKFLSKKCLTYWLGYANLYTWLAEAY